MNTQIQHYAHVDENGFLLGWYNDDEWSYEDIPTPNIEVQQSQLEEAQLYCHNKVAADGTTSFEDPRSEDEIAREDQEILNKVSRTYLADTDWYVIRLQETGQPIPQDILDERAAARERIVHLD